MHINGLKKQDNWATPKDIFEKACAHFNFKPTLDAAATATNTKCSKFFTKRQDSLKHEWSEPFWLNPPYSQVDKFIRHAIAQHKKHKVSCLILVYSKTDTKWWHDLIGATPKEMIERNVEPWWHKGRIKFLKKGKASKNSSPYPNVFLFLNAENPLSGKMPERKPYGEGKPRKLYRDTHPEWYANIMDKMEKRT